MLLWLFPCGKTLYFYGSLDHWKMHFKQLQTLTLVCQIGCLDGRVLVSFVCSRVWHSCVLKCLRALCTQEFACSHARHACMLACSCAGSLYVFACLVCVLPYVLSNSFVITKVYTHIYIYIYTKIKKPKLDVLEWILNKKTHFQLSQIFRLFYITFYSVCE